MLKSDKSFLNMQKPIAFISPSGISFINLFYSSMNYKRNTCITVFQHPENADSDSEAEEDKLEELETMLKEHDPEFQK